MIMTMNKMTRIRAAAGKSCSMPEFLLLALLVFFPSGMMATEIDRLEKNFKQPPNDARIMMRWWWFGPAVTKERLEQEMNLMKDGGIGGFLVQSVYPLSIDNSASGIRNLKLLSPEFMDALSFTASKAKELGLRFDLALGSGWPYGGPQFTASEAPGKLHYIEVQAVSGQSFVPLPNIKEGEKVIAAFLRPPKESGGEGGAYLEVPIQEAGARLPADRGSRTQVVFFIASTTGMKVKRPSFGGEGYVIDHYNPAAVERFINENAKPELQACGPNPPYAVSCDSLEMHGSDWTINFPDEFIRRRGYDLRPFLPALLDNGVAGHQDLRHDWGKTLTEIFNDVFLASFMKLARDSKTLFYIQNYGTPPAALHSYACVDLCEGEVGGGTHWKSFVRTRWASSASHLLGRPVTSSETWTYLHSPAFMATPLDMKAEADKNFLAGINQIIGHGWPYSPPGVAYPGWCFYAAGAFNEKNPWWIVMPDLSRYLQRVSYILRQGQPANDILLYLPNSDAWASFELGQVSMSKTLIKMVGSQVTNAIVDAGFNFDFFDDQLLERHGKLEGDKLAFVGAKYRVVVLPGVERIPVSTLQKLEAFARAGGIVIATKRLPQRAPGFKATAEEQQHIRDITARLFNGPHARGLFVQDEAQFKEIIVKRLTADVRFDPPSPEVGFIHRRTEVSDNYFLANTANTTRSVQATFRVTDRQPEWWNPLTGQVTKAAEVSRSATGITVKLSLEPYGSRVLIFSERKIPTLAEEKPVVAPTKLDLSKDWKVTFKSMASGNYPLGREIPVLSPLGEDQATRFFSGVTTYEKSFSLPKELEERRAGLVLDFGAPKPLVDADRSKGSASSPGVFRQGFWAMIESPVREAAVVYLNGKRAGSVWCPPYRLDVGSLLKTGENKLRIDVANLAVNAMARVPFRDYKDEYHELIARFGNRFQPIDMDLIRPMPFGLLGPVSLGLASQE